MAPRRGPQPQSLTYDTALRGRPRYEAGGGGSHRGQERDRSSDRPDRFTHPRPSASLKTTLQREASIDCRTSRRRCRRRARSPPLQGARCSGSRHTGRSQPVVATPSRGRLRWRRGRGVRTSRGAPSYARPAAPVRRGAKLWWRSGRRSRQASPARPRRLRRACRRRSAPDGSGGPAAWRRRIRRFRRRRRQVDTCASPSARRSRWDAPRDWACARSRGGWAGRLRRSRGRSVAMPRRAAAAWTTGRAPRNGTRTAQPGGPSPRSWRRTRPSAPMSRIGSPAGSRRREAPRWTGRRRHGRAVVMVVASRGDGRGHGAPSRSRTDCGATFPRTRRCASRTRPSTRRFTSSPAGACVGS